MASKYCRECDYDLRHVSEPRCPECGAAFDPLDPGTYHILPVQRQYREATHVAWQAVRLIRIALIITILIVVGVLTLRCNGLL